MNFEYEITVIVLTYYHEDYVEKAIKSVIDQKLECNFEIIISDDNSGDKTIDIANAMKKKYDANISIITHEDNVGTTQNLYDAFMSAKGKYISLLAGDDCYCDENKLSIQRNYLDNNSDCFAVCVTTENIYTDGVLTGEKSPDDQYRGMDFSQKDFASGINYPIHGVMIRNRFDEEEVRRIFHLSVEYSRYIEDLSLCLFFFEFGKVHILSDVLYRITVRRGNEENQHNFNSTYKGIDSALMHIELMVRLQKYFGRKVDLTDRLVEPSWAVFCYAIKKRKFNYLMSLRGVSVICYIKGAKKWAYNKCVRRSEI